MANYLNPSLFINGFNYYKDYYFGWLLFGTYTEAATSTVITPDVADNNYLPKDDICIGGFSVPLIGSSAFELSSEDTNVISTANSGLNENADLTVKAGEEESGTKFKFLKAISDKTLIYPDDPVLDENGAETANNININTRNEEYIDMNTDSSGLLLVAYKPSGKVVKGITEGEEETDYLNFKKVIDTYWRDVKYKSDGVHEYKIRDTSAAAQALINSDECIPIFYYTITSSSNVNSYNYTSFAVGNVSIALNGLTSE